MSSVSNECTTLVIRTSGYIIHSEYVTARCAQYNTTRQTHYSVASRLTLTAVLLLQIETTVTTERCTRAIDILEQACAVDIDDEYNYD
jgi:hypothetical protein